MMDSRERILRALDHKEADRITIHDSPWQQTVERRHTEGLPRDTTPADHFGYELINIGRDTTPRFPTEILETTDEFIVQRIGTGAVNRNLRDHATTPELVSRPVRTR